MIKLKLENVYSTLKKYDFTEYEAKIYVALLQNNPLNGNEIAMKSGVPSPKVYENLNRMCEKNTVFQVFDGSTSAKKLYSPLPYKELLHNLEMEFENDTALMANQFRKLSNKMNLEWSELYHVDGYTSSIDALNQMIQAAENTVFLSCWNSELQLLWNELLEAHKRGIHIVSILFDESQKECPWLQFKHHKGKYSNRRHIGELSCVLDEKRVLILHSTDEGAHAVISSHMAMTRTTLNYIRHDIYLNQIVEDFHDNLSEKYGKNLESLLDTF